MSTRTYTIAFMELFVLAFWRHIWQKFLLPHVCFTSIHLIRIIIFFVDMDNYFRGEDKTLIILQQLNKNYFVVK